MSKLKFGDWVVRKTTGERMFVFYVEDEISWLVNLKGNVVCLLPEYLEHLPDCTGWDWQPPLQLREGGYYKNRRGDIVGPIRVNKNSPEYPWVSGNGFGYTPGGRCQVTGVYDLIEEVDPPYREPNPGEMCEVSNDGKTWESNRRFIGKSTSGLFVSELNGHFLHSSTFARVRIES